MNVQDFNLIDSHGDGWNASQIDVYVDGSLVNSFTNDGSTSVDPQNFSVTVEQGSTLEWEYQAGSRYENEISYEVINDLGSSVFEDGPGPVAGTRHSEDVTCESVGTETGGETGGTTGGPVDDGCDYEIVLEDSYGDGWNASYLDVSVDGVLIDSYTNDGSNGIAPQTFALSVNDGSEIEWTYYSGSRYEDEISYKILDNVSTPIFEDGPAPVVNTTQTSTVVCDPSGGETGGESGGERGGDSSGGTDGGTTSGTQVSLAVNPAEELTVVQLPELQVERPVVI